MEKKQANIRVYTSRFTVAETMARLEAELARQNIPVFAKFDHRKNAQGVNLALRDTQVLVFGSPAAGTLLMQKNQRVAFELPLRLAAWQEADGVVRLAAPDLAGLAEAYGLAGLPVLHKIQDLLAELAATVAAPPPDPPA